MHFRKYSKYGYASTKKKRKLEPQPSTSGSTGGDQVLTMSALPSHLALLSPAIEMNQQIQGSNPQSGTSLQATKCELPRTYITMKHGQVLVNIDFMSEIQKEHDVFFSLTDLANGVSVGLVPPNAHMVPSLPCCGVVRLYHPTCAEADLFYRLQAEIVRFCSLHPKLPPYNTALQ